MFYEVMPRKFNYERAASALTDAIAIGDEAAAKRWNVSVRSIELWRVRLNTDPQLAEFFSQTNKLKINDWVGELPEAIAAGINFLKTAFEKSDCTNPEIQAALATGLKILADIDTTRRIIDVQLQQSQSSIAAESPLLNQGASESTIDTTATTIRENRFNDI